MGNPIGVVNHDLRSNNGKTLLLPPKADVNNLALPNVYADETARAYSLGTRYWDGDRAFFYCQAGSALIRYEGGANYDQWSVSNAAINIAAVVGATSISIPNTDATLNSLVGGYVVMFTSPLQMRFIIGNEASDSTDTVVTLDGALETALVAASTFITAYKPWYSNIYGPSAGVLGGAYVDYVTYVCIPVCTVASGSYFWGQTWGPCYAVASGTVPGSAANKRDLYFQTDGNVAPYGDGNAGIGGQYAGYLLPRTASGSGDQLYMLQLVP